MPHKDPEVNRRYKRDWYRRSRYYKGNPHRASPGGAKYTSYLIKKGKMAGYRILVLGDRVRGGWAYEHRFVWEQEVGPIPGGWEVHHSDGVRDHNRRENLECWPSREHKRWHGKARNGLNRAVGR